MDALSVTELPARQSRTVSLNLSPPTSPRSTSLSLLRHFVTVAAFNLLLWFIQVASGMQRWGDWDNTLVYTFAIGFSIWAIIEIGRGPLQDPGMVRGWPRPSRAIPLLAVAIIFGFLIGSWIGDLYCGCDEISTLMSRPVRLRSTLLFTVGAASIMTGFFYNRGKAAAQKEHIARAERDATLARLALLQSQLEPHMLFNTLANLRVLISLDPQRAQAMLDRLIGFLRATLNASRTEAHALSAEFERLDDYLQLMAVRMGARLQPRFDLPADLRDLPVPPLLLQPLVENGITHGLEPKIEGGCIEVSARRDGAHLLLAVRDTGVGLGAAPASGGTRFGLTQVRDRLQTLYGITASLTLEAVADDEGGGTLASIRLPMALPMHSPATPG